MLLTALIFLLATFLGGWVFVLLGQRGLDNLGVILSFGGSFIIGMCFLHLVPEAFGTTSLAGVFVIGGFLVQGLLEYLSKGIEHGHFHAHDHGEHCEGEFGWNRLPWAALLSLALHAALESMPVLDHSGHHHHEGHVHGPLSLDMIDWGLVTGLVLHKVPVAMVLMAMMIEQHVPKRTEVAAFEWTAPCEEWVDAPSHKTTWWEMHPQNGWLIGRKRNTSGRCPMPRRWTNR